jgi:hypothetical protein
MVYARARMEDHLTVLAVLLCCLAVMAANPVTLLGGLAVVLAVGCWQWAKREEAARRGRSAAYRLLVEQPALIKHEVLTKLTPTDHAMLARASTVCREAVAGLPRAGHRGSGGEKLEVKNFVSSLAMVEWAQEHTVHAYFYSKVLPLAAAGGHLQVVERACLALFGITSNYQRGEIEMFIMFRVSNWEGEASGPGHDRGGCRRRTLGRGELALDARVPVVR